MRRTISSVARALLAMTVLGLAAPAAAQAPGQAPATAGAATQAPAKAGAATQAPANAGAANNDAQVKRRYQIKVMEGVLVGAVRHGADQLGRQLQGGNPNLVLLTGIARARGFVLEGYGVFFDVEIPAMRESVAYAMRALEPDVAAARRILEQMRRQLQMVTDRQAKASLEQALRQLEAQVAPGPLRGAAERDRMVSGAAIVEEGPPAAAAPPPPAPPLDDPGALYTESVKTALVDSMLDYGAPMDLQPNEWLTVEARDGEGPLTPLENYEAVTLILRIKGSDLAEFQAKRMTREEARKRVEVREF